MITPVFKITQDAEYLYITIEAPYSKVSEVDIFIDGHDFKFHAKPYFLRLHLPGAIIEDDRASTVYDADHGNYKVKVAKQFPGICFEDLDMMTKLLATSGERKLVQPLIEVIDNDSNEPEIDDEDFDWHFPQSLHVESTSGLGDGYGFGNLKRDAFRKLQEDMQHVVQVSDLENSSLLSRWEQKMVDENDKFDPEHYLADYFENDDIERILKCEPPYKSKDVDDQFSDAEKMILKDLPNKEYLLDKTQLQNVYLGLVDILFSYAYNWRSTEGEYSVESAWNIRTVSAVLSWCVQCTTVQSTILSSCRRVMVFPLYRHWKLAKACKSDVIQILSKGRKYILKCLLDIHELFAKSDPYYVLNDLYIKDYCIWIQKANDQLLESLAQSIKDCKFDKKDLELEISELEEAAHLVIQEENNCPEIPVQCDTDSLSSQVEKLHL